MTDNLKDFLIALGNGEETFLSIINIPDEQFDERYEQIKTPIEQTLESDGFIEQLRIQALSMPANLSIAHERDGIQALIKEINDDKELSPLKKEFLQTIIEKSTEPLFQFMDNPTKRVKVQIKKVHENAKIPTYAHNGDAGMDIYSPIEKEIKPHEIVIVPTGLKMAIPLGYEMQIRPRSGMSAKTKIRVANSPATIDSNFRGEIGVILDNTGDETYTIHENDRIAQFILKEVPIVEFKEVDKLDETQRGEEGFGSSGK